jgi:hypothetical protein
VVPARDRRQCAPWGRRFDSVVEAPRPPGPLFRWLPTADRIPSNCETRHPVREQFVPGVTPVSLLERDQPAHRPARGRQAANLAAPRFRFPFDSPPLPPHRGRQARSLAAPTVPCQVNEFPAAASSDRLTTGRRPRRHPGSRSWLRRDPPPATGRPRAPRASSGRSSASCPAGFRRYRRNWGSRTSTCS